MLCNPLPYMGDIHIFSGTFVFFSQVVQIFDLINFKDVLILFYRYYLLNRNSIQIKISKNKGLIYEIFFLISKLR